MKQTTIASAITEFFVKENAQAITCKGGQMAIDSTKWIDFQDFEEAAEHYNKTVNRDVLHVGLLCQRDGDHTWKVYDEDCSMPDALRNPEMYASSDDVHVIAFEDLDEEKAEYMALADDLEEEDQQAWRERVNEVFGKAQKEMSAQQVLVLGDSLDFFEIEKRHPAMWSEDTMNYRLALVIDSSYDDDEIC